MSTFQDCSAAAQYCALGAAPSHAPAARCLEPVRLSGLEALGRYVGAADTPPRAAAPTPLLASRREPATA